MQRLVDLSGGRDDDRRLSRQPLARALGHGNRGHPCDNRKRPCRGCCAARGADILRLKSVIWADGFDTPFFIHGVQHIIDPPVRLARWTGKDRRSRVVVMGRDLPREALLDILKVLKTRPMVHSLPA